MNDTLNSPLAPQEWDFRALTITTTFPPALDCFSVSTSCDAKNQTHLTFKGALKWQHELVLIQIHVENFSDVLCFYLDFQQKNPSCTTCQCPKQASSRPCKFIHSHLHLTLDLPSSCHSALSFSFHLGFLNDPEKFSSIF